MLILEEEKYRIQAALSDISGFDIQAHEGKYELAIREIRNWLVSEANITASGLVATGILSAYDEFQEWYFKRQRENENIKDYPNQRIVGCHA